MQSTSSKRYLGLFQLIMITVISVDSLRNLPIAAQYGLALVPFYLLAGLTFFLPLAWIASRLATEYPNTGGSYLWVKAAFGKHFGYLSIWLQWIYNLIWYPTIFAFIAATLANLIHPGWETNKWFILLVSLGFFWLITSLHCFGIRMASWISTFCAVIGTLLPMLFIIGLAAYWLLSGHPSASPLTWNALIPNQVDLHNMAFFSNILFSLLGLEVIAMHAGDVKNPQKNFPRALAISSVLILTTLTLSSLALCIIVPSGKIALISGLMEAFDAFFSAYHFPHMVHLIGWAIIIGGVGIVSSWMLGLARGLQVAAISASNLPPILQRLNKRGMPVSILILQALIFSGLMTIFLLFPNVNSSYWILSALTAQFALLYYVILFAAAIKLLRKTIQSKLNKTLSVLLPSVGAVISFIGIIVGFVPPDQISHGGVLQYELFMLITFLGFCLLLAIIFRKRFDSN